jgi:hypothetical protein
MSRCCENCAKTGVKLRVCAGCTISLYCSRECQIKHWKRGHRVKCRKPSSPPSSSRPTARERFVTDSLFDARTSSICAICQNLLGQPDDCFLSCGHIFHQSCLQQLSTTQATPSCVLCNAWTGRCQDGLRILTPAEIRQSIAAAANAADCFTDARDAETAEAIIIAALGFVFQAEHKRHCGKSATLQEEIRFIVKCMGNVQASSADDLEAAMKVFTTPMLSRDMARIEMIRCLNIFLDEKDRSTYGTFVHNWVLTSLKFNVDAPPLLLSKKLDFQRLNRMFQLILEQ